MLASRWAILQTVSDAVARAADAQTATVAAVAALAQLTGREVSAIHLLTSDGATLRLDAEHGLTRLGEPRPSVRLGDRLIGHVAATRALVHVADAKDTDGLLARTTGDPIRAFLCLPIETPRRLHGTVTIARSVAEPFDDEDVTVTRLAAVLLGLVLDGGRAAAESVRQADQLTRAQAQLVRSAKLAAVGELAAGVAHEINNPLTTILGQCHLLELQPELAEDVRSRLEVIAEETARVARIIHNLMVFSRQQPGERRPSSLAEQVERVLELKGYQLQREGVGVVTELGECPPVWTDENRVQQVLLALIQHAQHGMSEQTGGQRTLLLRTRRAGDRALIEVSETTSALPADALARVFDPFGAGEPAGEPTLSVAQTIIAEQGGELRAEHRPDGRTVFTIDLPFGGPAAAA